MYNSTKRSAIKLLYSMTRLTFLMTIVTLTFSGVILASDVKSQNLKDVKISLDEKPNTLSALLGTLEKKSGFSFAYTQEIGNITGFHLTGKTNTLYDVLTEICRQKNLRFVRENYLIAIVRAPKPQQPGRISGKIMDDRGEVLPAAGIKIVETGAFIQSGVDGTYNIAIKPGNYTLEVSYISFQTKRITDINVKEGQLTNLNVTLNPSTSALQQVTVTGNYKKESVAGLYVQQKNAAGLTDGISAEQISRTPDRHVGETLGRITGVSTTNGKRVVVRGIAERYNVATLNGSVLPSTDVLQRNFEFDLIPTNMVDQVVVSKSITPDMPYGFAGGLVQITTKAIPSENFISFSTGIGINDRTQGKDFMGYGRGKYDYLGFDDGTRNRYPEGILDITSNFDPRKSDAQNKITAAQVAEQNKRIGGTERLGARIFAAAPSQNYQLTIGRLYSLSKTKVRKLGYIGSASYRNTQRNSYIANMRRGDWAQRATDADDITDVNTGNRYNFNTSLATLLNVGFNTEKHQLNSYNMYNRVFDNEFNRLTGWDNERPKSSSNPYPTVEEDERPKFTDILQNKLVGKHSFGNLSLDWSGSKTYLKQVEKDATYANLNNREYANYAPLYSYYPGQASDPGWGTFHRGKFSYRETNTETMFNAAYNFRWGNTSHILKAGYNSQYRRASNSWLVLPIVVSNPSVINYSEIPIQEWGNYMDMKNRLTSLFYNTSKFTDAEFEGKSITHGSYLMLDNKIGSKLRLVWGARAEYFRLDTLKNPASLLIDQNTKLLLDEEKNWRFMPSANATYSPLSSLNIRASYAKSAVRPGLMENSRFSRVDPNLGSRVRSNGVTTTSIDNYDAKIEWFPGAGELISVGYFYKHFDKPAEFYRINNSSSGIPYVTLSNSEWAKVSGWEFEVRKSLNFILPKTSFLNNIYLMGNLTIQKSEVKGREIRYNTDKPGKPEPYYYYMKYPRQLYGQVPLLYNIGAQYAGDKLGLNITYNYMDYKTSVTSSEPMLAEYERPRGQLDLQVSYRFLSKRMEAKLNMSNLTDAPFRFFVNDAYTYQVKPGTENLLNAEWAERFEYKPGFSEKFEKGYTEEGTGILIGDRESFTRYIGRTYSLSLSYKF
ncbi:TonB-dependent receptor [Pedobacter xixiisoli]|uniref:TonB-dependent receptor n=2 Tax=Pedobacter xixiisoli TaxID=1476464 RepID=A0A286A0B4_9SPHI|nr:TonB-dependent receptor [Pedobacter xixiisoli]